jgi:integrase
MRSRWIACAAAALAIGPGSRRQRNRAILLLAFACASRQSEIAGLDVADLRFDRQDLERESECESRE